MDRERLRKKVVLSLLTSPWTLFPVVVGLTTVAISWAAGLATGWPGLLGIGSVLFGLGTLASRWVLKGDDITRKAFEQLQGEQDLEHTKSLDRLDIQLQGNAAQEILKSVKPVNYGKCIFCLNCGDQDVILPLTVLRRIDCVLAPTKAKVLSQTLARGPLRPCPAQVPV